MSPYKALQKKLIVRTDFTYRFAIYGWGQDNILCKLKKDFHWEAYTPEARKLRTLRRFRRYAKKYQSTARRLAR